MKLIMKTFVGLSFLIGTVFPSTFVLATPPTPPVEIQLPNAEALAALQPDKGTFIVLAKVKMHQDVEQLTLIVRTTRMGILGPREGQGQDHPLKGLKKGESQTVEVKIPAQDKNGLYRIEAALQIERQRKKGVVSKKVLIQIVEKGSQRLTTPVELRKAQVLEKKRAFQEALSKNQKDPDVRLLMDNLTPVSPDQAKMIKLYRGPVMKRAAVAGPPAVIKPYLRDESKNSQARDRSLSKKPKMAQVQPVPLIELRGQVVFEDWYTNTPCDPTNQNDPYYPCIPGPPPVLSGLPNATISTIVRAQGYDIVVATTVTDDNGNWTSFLHEPTYEGWDVYYTVTLDNENFNVHDATSNAYVMASSIRTATGTVDFGQEAFTTNTEAAQVFFAINRGWNHIVTEGGQDPGLVEVQYPAVYSHWDNVDERVEIEAGHENIPDIILHEYGHALMHYAFGGNQISPGGPHVWNDVLQDTGLAYSEGWAHAFALSVCPDGQYTEDEGSYEGLGEWPTCTDQTSTDVGVNIEGFILAGSRLGEQNEGRVGAAINDLLDVQDDTNLFGGIPNEDRGRTEYEDANAANRISLATVYRDHMWGFLHNDFQSFYGALLGDLTGTTKNLTSDILLYNWMGIFTGPFLCVASKVAMAMSPEYAKVLDGLRAFRDKVMKPIVVGRHWMQSYYSHSPEMAILLIGDSEARKAGQIIVEHFSGIGQTLKDSQGFERLSQSKESVLPPRVKGSIQTISKVIHAKGSKELKQKLAEARELLKPFEGLSVSQAAQRVSKMEKAGRGKDTPRVQPLKFAPGSQQVDWELIKKNVPKGEWPGTHNKRTGEPAGALVPQREGKE